MKMAGINRASKMNCKLKWYRGVCLNQESFVYFAIYLYIRCVLMHLSLSDSCKIMKSGILTEMKGLDVCVCVCVWVGGLGGGGEGRAMPGQSPAQIKENSWLGLCFQIAIQPFALFHLSVCDYMYSTVMFHRWRRAPLCGPKICS